MTTAEDFENYLRAKVVLNQLACKFYKCDISEYRAKELGISYTQEDIFNSLGNIACAFHRYTGEGLYIWNKLGITKPLLLMRDMKEAGKKKDIKARDKDYHKEYLEIKLVCLNMIEGYYKAEVPIDYAKENNIKYDSKLDIFDGAISGFAYFFDETGKAAWDLLGIETSFVSKSELDRIRIKLSNEIMIKSKVIKSHEDIKSSQYSNKTIDELNLLRNTYVNKIYKLREEVEEAQFSLHGDMLNFKTVQGFVDDLSNATKKIQSLKSEIDLIDEEINSRKVKKLN